MGYKDKDLLFYDNVNEKFDGDLKIENGDLKIATAEQTLKQEFVNRANTNNPEWFHHLMNGADFEDLKGMPNNQDTAKLGENKLISALTHDGKFRESDININSVPTSRDSITYFCFLNIGEEEPILIKHTVKL